ncbi:hypothetical protein ACIP8Z_08980 [Streptomyces sp. NPDC088553]|uniref:hypothetical protein n=1 Tax=Streptomyces sp. NPDC088553 TaxID=3365864 RepID=UPI00381D3DED
METTVAASATWSVGPSTPGTTVRRPHVVHSTARGRRGTTVLRPALFIGAAEETMKVMAPPDGHALNPASAIPLTAYTLNVAGLTA